MDKKRIILAEDEPAYRNLLLNKLIQEGYDAIAVTNGEELLEAIKTHKPHLILLDLIMPKKNGYQILEELQQDKTLSDIIVIALSNLGQDEEIDRAKKLGARDFIIKSDETFYTVLEKIKKEVDK